MCRTLRQAPFGSEPQGRRQGRHTQDKRGVPDVDTSYARFPRPHGSEACDAVPRDQPVQQNLLDGGEADHSDRPVEGQDTDTLRNAPYVRLLPLTKQRPTRIMTPAFTVAGVAKRRSVSDGRRRLATPAKHATLSANQPRWSAALTRGPSLPRTPSRRWLRSVNHDALPHRKTGVPRRGEGFIRPPDVPPVMGGEGFARGGGQEWVVHDLHEPDQPNHEPRRREVEQQARGQTSPPS